MNYFYDYLTYIEVQKMKYLCQNYIVISLIFIFYVILIK